MTIEPARLSEILRLHADWLRAVGGGVRADLSDADLSGANLSYANLSVEDALAHWGSGYEGDREIGDRYLRALNELPECPAVDAEAKGVA